MLSRRELYDSWSGAAPVPFWLDRPDRPAARPGLRVSTGTDLAVVGGGFSGLWTALLAKERDPGREVVLLEAGRVASAATGRNGGFCAASLTHGVANGRARFPGESGVLDRLGRRNLGEIEATIRRHGIACDFERTGTLTVATQPYQVPQLAAAGGEVLSQREVRAQVNSPAYLAGVWHREDTALLDPAKLAWGLAAAAESAGRVHRAGGRHDQVRRRRHARPAGRRAHRTHRTCHGPHNTTAVPARTPGLPRHPGHPLVTGPRRPQRWQAKRLAAHPRPARPGLRLLTALLPRQCRGGDATCQEHPKRQAPLEPARTVRDRLPEG